MYFTDLSEGYMTKRVTSIILCFLVAISLFAGDVAEYIDIGFSSDGETYLFAQYGRTDKVYQSYAEIYSVDIAKNAYVPGDVFITKPSTSTANKTGKQVYDALFAANKNAILKYSSSPAGIDNTLYIRSDETKSPTDIIKFKDFERSSADSGIVYMVKLVPTYTGKGAKTKSSFSINIDKTDNDGNLIVRTVAGNPSYKRDGVTRYCIDRILCSSDGKSLIFIVEKQITGDDGVSIRYMVETVKID